MSLPTPYYEDDSVVLYHGDALELVPLVVADVLVTDPPFGVNFTGKKTKRTARIVKRTGIKPSGYTIVDDPEIGPAVVELALERVTRGAVFSGSRLMFDYPKPRDVGCVFLPGGSGIGPHGFICFTPVLYYGTRARNGLAPTSISSGALSDTKDHPCPKPMPWLYWLVDLISNPGEIVLDPFAGSGTTLRAAKDLGRRAIGIELEERYCDVVARRLAQETLTGWRPELEHYEQTEIA